MTLSPSLSLSHTLVVPTPLNKLISISQVTAGLNGMVIIYPTFCFFQDILTKKIIGRGTKTRDYTTWMTSAQEELITYTT